MNDVSIIDLFWLLLKLLAALGLVGLLACALFLVWVGVKRLARGAWNIWVYICGRDASVAATTLLCITVVILVSCVFYAAKFFYPSFLR